LTTSFAAFVLHLDGDAAGEGDDGEEEDEAEGQANP
jgi:hypothetical protein